MDLGTLITNIQTRLGSRSDVTTAVAENAANKAYRRLCNAFAFYELEDTSTDIVSTPDVTTYAPPSDLQTVLTLRDLTNKTTLGPKDIEWYEAQDDTTVARSIPEYFVRYSDSIILDPPPNGTYEYRMRYRKRPAALSASTDVPVIPEEWHEVIEILGASDLCFQFSLDSKGMTFKNEALGIVEGLQEDPTGDRRRRTGQLTFQRVRTPGGTD
jgi:hypothetical protein